jgi:hypothetical protein
MGFLSAASKIEEDNDEWSDRALGRRPVAAPEVLALEILSRGMNERPSR